MVIDDGAVLADLTVKFLDEQAVGIADVDDVIYVVFLHFLNHRHNSIINVWHFSQM